MSLRTVLVLLLCLLLILPGGSAIAGMRIQAAGSASSDASSLPQETTAAQPSSLADHIAPGSHSGCHDTPPSTDMTATGEMPADPAGHPCCGHCDCGCLPGAAFAFTPAPIARSLPGAPMAQVRLPTPASVDPPLLRPPITA